MSCYIIAYDLKRPGQQYSELYEAIKSYRRWARINDSVWAVVTDNKAKEVRDHLGSYIDKNDSIFVLKSGVEAAWRNVRCRNEWLKDNL